MRLILQLAASIAAGYFGYELLYEPGAWAALGSQFLLIGGVLGFFVTGWQSLTAYHDMRKDWEDD